MRPRLARALEDAQIQRVVGQIRNGVGGFAPLEGLGGEIQAAIGHLHRDRRQGLVQAVGNGIGQIEQYRVQQPGRPELQWESIVGAAPDVGQAEQALRQGIGIFNSPALLIPDLDRQARRAVQRRRHPPGQGDPGHITRQDSDYFLTSTATACGATVLPNTLIQDIRAQPDGVEVVTQKGRACRAEYVVDAGRMKSLLASRAGWRHRDCRSHSRTLFTHMIDVPCFNRVSLSGEQFGHPYRLSEGTLHHLFHGGWLWVIPFNNHATVVRASGRTPAAQHPRLHHLVRRAARRPAVDERDLRLLHRPARP